MLVQLSVHKGVLHEGLTVVEHAIYLDGSDVIAQCGELALLNRTDLSLRIEHVNMDSIDTQEAVGNGRSRVARGGHEHIHLLTFVLLLNEILQESRHESGAHILEGEGRTVEQFEGIDIVLDLHHRTVERQGVVDDLLERLGIDVLAKEGVSYRIGYLLECLGLDGVEKLLRQLLDALWHIQTSVFCQTLDHCLVQIGYRSLTIRAIILHTLFYFH